MPLSVTTIRSGGTCGNKSSVVCSDVSNERKLRLLMPIRGVLSAQCPLQLGRIVNLSQHHHSERHRDRFVVNQLTI